MDSHREYYDEITNRDLKGYILNLYKYGKEDGNFGLIFPALVDYYSENKVIDPTIDEIVTQMIKDCQQCFK